MTAAALKRDSEIRRAYMGTKERHLQTLEEHTQLTNKFHQEEGLDLFKATCEAWKKIIDRLVKEA